MKKSEYIKGLIRSKGFKIKDMALKMGITQASLSNKINGHRIFKEKEIDTLLKILNMSYEEVFNVNEVKLIDNNKVIVVVDNYKVAVSKPVAEMLKRILDNELKKEKEVI